MLTYIFMKCIEILEILKLSLDRSQLHGPAYFEVKHSELVGAFESHYIRLSFFKW